jgi:hypothetical protein
MHKAKRPKLRFLPPSPDRSPTPTAVDKDIAQDGGSSVAIEKSNERLQASKKMRTPGLSQIIEQRTLENSQLNVTSTTLS